MQSGLSKNETQQNLSQSRILFEQVVVDNQPSEEQVIQRAEELQIDDLQLARQSLTKELQPYWRPYMNRYEDIYYVNLKERKAYVDHPIDMQTKILYAKRHKKPLPRFKSYPLDEVAESVDLIEEEIRKWQRGELAYTQSIPSQLNIVYEESQESQTQREKSEESQQDQSSSSQSEEYIENLQKSQRQNQKNVKISPRQEKPALDKRHKKFPTLHDSQSQDDSQADEDQHLSPQLQKLLLEYEQQIRKQHEKQIHAYRVQKQENYSKKQQLFRQRLKSKQDSIKFNIMEEYQTEIEEKNSLNFHKETQKIKLECIEKLQRFESSLQKEKQAIEKIQSLQQEKKDFIQSLEERLQRRLLQGKCIKSQEIQREVHGTYYLSAIKELSNKKKEQFQKDSFKVIQQKANEKLSQKGIMNLITNERSYPASLAAMYQGLVKKELKNIDRLLVQNEASRNTRRRSRSIFGKQRSSRIQEQQGHIKFTKQLQTSHLIRAQTKQNDHNLANIYKRGEITQIIQQNIMKSSQNNLRYQQRRNKIFNISRTDTDQKGAFNSKHQQIQSKSRVINQLEIKRQVWQKTTNYPYSQPAKLDRRSMCLRMMKRIL